jgi:hypothetical protein
MRMANSRMLVPRPMQTFSTAPRMAFSPLRAGELGRHRRHR